MNINRLFSTEERVRILESVLYKTSLLKVSDVAKELGLSKGLVSKFFDILTEEGISKKSGNKFVVRESLATRAIKILLNLKGFETSIFKRFEFIRGAGLYGSLVKGENTEGSDIDLWLLIDEAKDEDQARLTNELKRKYGNVRPLYLSKAKINALKNENPVFYYSLVFGSINIFGEGIETV